MDTGNIVPDEEIILNNIKNMYKSNWGNVRKYYKKVTSPLSCSYFKYSGCDMAAERGHLDILKYAHENGCPLDESACTLAALKGHLDILYYLYENEAPYATPAVIHPNCKEFFDIFGKHWMKGDYTLNHSHLKPAKN